MKKTRAKVIKPEDVPAIFDDACVLKLVRMLGPLQDVNTHGFAKDLRGAACDFAVEVMKPTANELHHEIRELHAHASRQQYERVAERLAGLSPTAREARDYLGKRGVLPSPGTLRDLSLRDEACKDLEGFCALGAQCIEGRRRPSGKRSRTWRTHLYAPPLSPNFLKQDAERLFIIALQLAYLNNVPRPLSWTTKYSKPTPFARMAQECLRLVGAPHANAVQLINDLHRQRRADGRLGLLKNMAPVS
jgi:hypothetical protein